jgi:hypothetical protein
MFVRSINGINMKHSQHKNLIQLFHKAVDQGPQALPSLPDEDVPASTRPVERLGPIQWAETAGPTRLRARQNRQNAPRGQGTIALKITAARGAGQASRWGKFPPALAAAAFLWMALEGRRFARERGLNPRQVVDRVSTLAKSALAKAEEAAAEVAVMPAGPHAILDQIKEAVQRRATTLLEQLQTIGEATPLETVEG